MAGALAIESKSLESREDKSSVDQVGNSASVPFEQESFPTRNKNSASLPEDSGKEAKAPSSERACDILRSGSAGKTPLDFYEEHHSELEKNVSTSCGPTIKAWDNGLRDWRLSLSLAVSVLCNITLGPILPIAGVIGAWGNFAGYAFLFGGGWTAMEKIACSLLRRAGWKNALREFATQEPEEHKAFTAISDVIREKRKAMHSMNREERNEYLRPFLVQKAAELISAAEAPSTRPPAAMPPAAAETSLDEAMPIRLPEEWVAQRQQPTGQLEK